MVAQPEDVVPIMVVAGVGRNSLEYCTGGRPAKLGDVDRAFIPWPTAAIPLNMMAMRRSLSLNLQPHLERHPSAAIANAREWIE